MTPKSESYINDFLVYYNPTFKFVPNSTNKILIVTQVNNLISHQKFCFSLKNF